MTDPAERNIQIRQVWEQNVEEEFKLIREKIEKHSNVSVDVAFAGYVVQHVGDLNDLDYKTMKANVQLSKPLQVGLTLSDEEGDQCVWQFNLRDFNLQQDIYARDSINLLSESGIDFSNNNRNGVSGREFAELLMSSGLVMDSEVRWITFQGAYDFGYLVTLLSGKELPDTEKGFYDYVKVYFPNLYDVKYLIKFANIPPDIGLDRLAQKFGVERVGMRHQAGSNSLVTSRIFKELKQRCFGAALPESHAGVLIGMGF